MCMQQVSAYILEMFSVSRTLLGVAIVKCRERMSTDQATLAFISSSEKPQPAGKSCTVPSRPIVHVTRHTRVSELNNGHLSQVT